MLLCNFRRYFEFANSREKYGDVSETSFTVNDVHAYRRARAVKKVANGNSFRVVLLL